MLGKGDSPLSDSSFFLLLKKSQNPKISIL